MRKPIRPPPPAPEPTPSPTGAREARTRRRRADGERSHREILRAAAELASMEGLEGLTIASLAEHVGLSKSGLFAHFRSKAELQLETISLALEIFNDEVVRPALAGPEGTARLRALARGFLEHVRRRTFPGGCFFAAVASEVDSHPGPVRDRVAAIHRGWHELFERGVADAQARGEIARRADAHQVAFEVTSMLAGAHGDFLLQGDPSVLDRARRGVESVLAYHAPKRGKPAA